MPIFKTKHESGKIRKNGKGKSELSSRPDIFYIDDDKIGITEIKTGKGKLGKNRKILGEAYKTGTAVPTGESFWKFISENKHAFPDYQKKLKELEDGFTGTTEEFDNELEELNTKWLSEKKKEFKKGMEIHKYNICRYPGRLE
ncbi:hypothetical protein [Bartonella sp. B30(2025)]